MIGALMYAWQSDTSPEKPSPGAMLIISIIIVAFLTAVIVNLWDWAKRLLTKRSGIKTEALKPLDHSSPRGAVRNSRLRIFDSRR